jgi:hypothetical protein
MLAPSAAARHRVESNRNFNCIGGGYLTVVWHASRFLMAAAVFPPSFVSMDGCCDDRSATTFAVVSLRSNSLPRASVIA